MDIRVLGAVEASIDGRLVDLGAPKQRAVLAALVAGGRGVRSIDSLIDAVWGDAAPRTAQHSIQLYVSGLRRALGDPDGEVLRTRAPGYELVPGSFALDASEFERLAAEGFALLVDDPLAGLQRFEQALDLWRGPPFADVMYLDFVQAESRRLETLRLDVEDARDEARLRLGAISEALASTTRRVHDHPLRERTRALHMRALASSGRQADALRSFRDLEVELGAELGIGPSRELVELEAQILMQEPSVVRVGTGGVRNPYKGLEPFDEADRADFHGRDAVVDALVAAVLASRFTAVVGPSGSGKSSVVRAGLVPRLREQYGIVPTVLLPGTDPLRGLDSVELEPGSAAGGALIVDQLEEVYLAPGSSPDEFLSRLGSISLGGSVRVVVVVRADYLDRLLSHPLTGELVAQGLFPLTAMGPAELEQAAVRPAERSGLRLDPDVVTQLVADVVTQPGGLPLFQFTLTEMVDTSGGSRVTIDDYRALGGLGGALTSRAETAIGELSDGELETARQLALRLVGLEGEAPSRRRLDADDLLALDLDRSEIRTVLETLARHRLVTFDRSHAGSRTVEFAHDALLSAWPRLATWIDEGQEDVRRSHALAIAVDEWERASRSDDFLPQGGRLAAYSEWRANSTLRLTREEREFLEVAQERDDERRLALDAAASHEQRLIGTARRRLWAISVLVAAFVVTAGVLALTALSGGPKAALVYDGRGTTDFGDLVAAGWDRAVEEFDLDATEFSPLAGTSDELAALVEQGHELVVVIGVEYAAIAYPVAETSSNTFFAVIDGEGMDLGPMALYEFSSEEGSFLAGAAAAMTTETGVVGFIGGWDAPPIGAFRAGFEAGARYVDPSVRVVATYVSATHDTRAAFLRPDLGAVAAAAVFAEGADVVFHAAGASGLGVIQEAVEYEATAESHVWVIGVDVDQYLQATPAQRGHILTSMVKRLDVAVERAVADFVGGMREPATHVLGLADGALHLATSGGYIDSLQPELESISDAIVSGEIVVPNEPTGPLLERPELYGDLPVVIVNHADGTCSYEGPTTVALGVRLDMTLHNETDEARFIGVVPLTRHMTLEEVMRLESPADAPPEELVIEEMVGATVRAGGELRVASSPIDARSHAIYCVGPVAVPAAVIVGH